MTREEYKNKFSEILQRAEEELILEDYEQLLDEVGSEIDWELDKINEKKQKKIHDKLYWHR